jgi:Formamidopyrimidine-DNA glycosylase
VGAFQNSFAVYGKGGQPCGVCGRPLEKVRVAGRGTVFCPHCQK